MLLLDIKTRWNSIIPMLERILLLKDCIKDSLEELSSLSLFYNVDFDLVVQLCNVLLPVKLTIEALCRSNANIIQAEGALSFLYKKLEQQHTEIAKNMLIGIKTRMEQRQNKNLINLATYILNPCVQLNKDLIVYAINLLDRLYGVDNINNNNVSDDDLVVCEENFDMVHELQSEIDRALAEPVPKGDFDMLRQEFILYRKTNNKTKNISLLYKAIQSVKPSSTECERAFSIAGNFCTKIRSRLGDQSLNALVFLKFYYKSVNI